jgi:hypothetical protein
MQRRGSVFDDHYHARLLRSPTELVEAIAYVLGNHEHHYGASQSDGADPYSSLACDRFTILCPPKTWLVRKGWRRARIRSSSTRKWLDLWLAAGIPSVVLDETMRAA